MRRNRIIPLLRLHDSLIVPIQLDLSDDLVTRLTDDVTEEIERSSVSGLIIDLAGLELMDSYVTRCVRDLALTARVMGVDTIVCGLRWSVVVTLVEMGLAIPGVRTALNLEQALSMLDPHDLAEEGAEGEPATDDRLKEDEPSDASSLPRRRGHGRSDLSTQPGR